MIHDKLMPLRIARTVDLMWMPVRIAAVTW